ncbi:MAG TPA: MFS transporter [Solirubrobacteraceae bacterium]|nr:MFS transporter [Solirubrobacteraceae bacterium]
MSSKIPEGAGDRLTRGTIMALVAMSLAVFVVANDFTALSVALPQIERQFDADVGGVQWVINAYALVFGVFIVTGGRLADMFGRRRIFFVGAGIFAVFSVLGGVAQSAGWLIAARALMGIGGALMWPATLGMTYAILPESKAGLAGGLIIGVAGIGNALGPLLGGVLTDVASWRWVLLLNLPVAAIACFVTWREVSEPSDRARTRIDYWGVVSLSLGLTALLVALDQVTDWGFGDPKVIGLLVAFVILIGAFPFIERRAGEDALLPPELIHKRQFMVACSVVPLLGTGFFVLLLYLPQYMQKLLGYSPLKAGVGLLPMMAVFGAVSFVAGNLYNRMGARLSAAAGAGCITIGLVVVGFADVSTGYGLLAGGMAVFGVGVGLAFSALTTAGVTALDPAHASLAGGVLYMSQVAGSSVGLGLVTAIFTTTAQDKVHRVGVVRGLTQVQEHAVNGILAGTGSAQHLLSEFPQAGPALNALSRQAFVEGTQTGFRVAAGLAALGFVIAAVLIKGRPQASPAPIAEPSAAAA